jgi:hypothetical protein
VDKRTYFGGRTTARRARRAICVGAFVLASIASGPAAAESLFLTGAETSRDGGYIYGALLAPLPGSTLGNGFVQRYWAEWLRYEYVGGSNQVIEARAPGFEAALGYQKGHANGYFGTYAGIYHRNVSLSPDDSDSTVRGSQTRLRVQLEAEQRFASVWRVNGIASYVFVQEGYWLRARLLRAVRGPVLFGVEALAQGDPAYKGHQIGLVVTGFEPVPRLSLGFKLGARKIEGRSTGSYVGFELGKVFGK